MNEHTFERLRKISIKEAQKSNHKIKLGAVIMRKNRPLSVGYNQNKTSPKLLKYFRHATIHAEICACQNVVNKNLLKGADIYVFRETKDGKPAFSRPCSLCCQYLYDMGVKRAYWTTNDFPYFDSDLIENMYNQIDRKECLETNCRKPTNPPEGKKKKIE